jgi:hypothetical protein
MGHVQIVAAFSHPSVAVFSRCREEEEGFATNQRGGEI